MLSSEFKRIIIHMHCSFVRCFPFCSNAPVICIHGPPTTTYGDSGGRAGLMCRAITFWLSPQCRGIGGVFILGPLPQWYFLLMLGGAKSRVVTTSLSLQGGAYTRALKIEKSPSPPIPVGVGGGRGYRWLVHKQGAAIFNRRRIVFYNVSFVSDVDQYLSRYIAKRYCICSKLLTLSNHTSCYSHAQLI